MGYYEKNCSECDNYFGDQCSNCAAAEREERLNSPCEYSGNTVRERDCRLKATSTKQDSCSACGYYFNYP